MYVCMSVYNGYCLTCQASVSSSHLPLPGLQPCLALIEEGLVIGMVIGMRIVPIFFGKNIGMSKYIYIYG